MRHYKFSSVFFLVYMMCLSSTLWAQSSVKPSAQVNKLIGTWQIDLRPTPKAEAYYQIFRVDAIEGKSFRGTFYGSKIQDGLLNQDWDKPYFAFTTQDQSNTYYHTGYLEDGQVFGMSFSKSRKLLAPWSGKKKK